MKDRYSFIAPVYTSLARSVFGLDLKQAKVAFCHDVKGKKILIIGGGDGVDYVHFIREMKGEYWELSAAMLSKAQSNLKGSGLTFHLGNFKAEKGKQFDEVWLHFVLDTMKDDELEKFLSEVKKSLKVDAQIYFCDFFPPKTKTQKILHALMISFFRLTADHTRKDVPNYERCFRKLGFLPEEEKKWRKGWVKAQLWRQNS